VQQSLGFIDTNNERKVLKLKKALYGLRQAPRHGTRSWMASLASLDFDRCPSEHALYMRDDMDSYLLVSMHVDDLMITGTTII
jgi:hypothetical protein